MGAIVALGRRWRRFRWDLGMISGPAGRVSASGRGDFNQAGAVLLSSQTRRWML